MVITPVGWRQTQCGPTVSRGSLLGLASSAPTYRRDWLNLCGFGHMVCDELYGINSNVNRVMQIEMIPLGPKTGSIGVDCNRPGKPRQNAYIARYNCMMCYDRAGRYRFESINDVQPLDHLLALAQYHCAVHMGAWAILP